MKLVIHRSLKSQSDRVSINLATMMLRGSVLIARERVRKHKAPYSTVSYCLSARPFVTANASVEQSGIYSCIVMSGGLLTSRSVEVRVQGKYLAQLHAGS